MTQFLFTHNGQDTVEVVVECVSTAGFMMSHFDDSQLKLTSYHPVLDTRNGPAQWTHPVSLVGAVLDKNRNSVYSVLFTNRSVSIVVNDIPCITLAHGIENDSVATHVYFGTESVVNDLKTN